MTDTKPKSIPMVVKLSMMISLLVITGISVISIAMLTKQSELQDKQVADLGIAMAQQLSTSATEPLFTDDSLALHVLISNFVKLPRVRAAIIIDKNDDILASEGDSSGSIGHMRELILASKQQNAPLSETLKDGRLLVTADIRFNQLVAGHVFVIVETDSLFVPYTHILKLVLIVSVLVVVGSLIFAYFISRHFSRPISQLLEASLKIGQGNFDSIVHDRRNDELGRLIDAFNAMGDGLYRKTQVESLLSRFLAKDIADQVLDGLDTVKVDGERVQATVLFVDIVGFTGMSERLSPEQVAELLNEYFSYFTVCSSRYFGTIDKFIGDCAMVIFGAPKKNPQHPFNAVSCAVLMQKLNRTINAKRHTENSPAVQLRIGINTGQMLAGVLGTAAKMEYTVVGDSVNLASRLCHEAEPGEIIVSHDVFDNLPSPKQVIAHRHKSIRVRGKEKAVDTYLIDDIAREHQLTMDNLIEDVLNSHNPEKQ